MQLTEAMSYTSQSYRALNGDEVSLAGDKLNLTLPWSVGAKYMKDGMEFGFQSGPRGMADDLIHGFAFTEFYQGYQGGQLRIGSMSMDDEYGLILAGYEAADKQWIAAWEGKWFSVFAVLRVRREVEPDLISQFDDFMIHETPLGIVLEPVVRSKIEMFHAELTKEIPELGLLSILNAEDRWGVIPPGAGTPVGGGELFLGNDESYFLLVNNTTISMIQPLKDAPEIDDPLRLRILENLKVEWTKS